MRSSVCLLTDTRREYVMVPILDMVNHRKNVNNNYYYSSGPFTRQTGKHG